MSWMSPLTVPMTTLPIVAAPVSASSGRRIRHPALHRVGGEEHLGDEENPVPEVDADDAHAFDERVVEDPLRRPSAFQQDVRAFLDLFLQAVVEIVVHLRDELVVGQRPEIEFFLFACTVFAIELVTLHGGGSSVASG